MNTDMKELKGNEPRNSSHECLTCSKCFQSECNVCNINILSVKTYRYQLIIFSIFCILISFVSIFFYADIKLAVEKMLKKRE